jgi:sulfate transport system permease protein
MTAQLDDALAAEAVGASSAPGRPSRRRGAATGLRLGSASGVSLGVIVLWMSLLVLLPLAAVVGKASDSGWSGFWSAVTQPETRSAVLLTVVLALLVATVNAVMGTLIAWVLVRERFRGSAIVEFVIDIPFALPTVVAGLVMLALYGSNGAGPDLFGTRAGLFVALLFVTLPFTVRTVQPVLIDLDRESEQAAASLGASSPVVFRRIVLPQLLPAIASGTALAFARALGEYGSLVFISSAIPFKTEFAAQIIYGKLQDADHPARATQQAAAIATILLLASVLVLIVLNVIERRVARRG